MTPPVKSPPKARWRAASRRRMVATNAWRRLTEWSPDDVSCGAVFRFPARWPYEKAVDYLLAQYDGDRFALIVASGIKAGLVSVVLPVEAHSARPNIQAVSRRWLIANWEHWIYPECAARDVFMRDMVAAPA
jgi:anti-sigma factor RsiW